MKSRSSPSALRSAEIWTTRLFSSTTVSGQTRLQDLVLGDEPATRLGENHEHIEGAAAKLDRDPIGAELPPVRQQPEPTELDTAQGLVDHLHGCLLRSFNEILYSIKGVKQRSANKFDCPGLKEPVVPRRYRVSMTWRRPVSLLEDFRRDRPRRQGL